MKQYILVYSVEKWLSLTQIAPKDKCSFDLFIILRFTPYQQYSRHDPGLCTC